MTEENGTKAPDEFEQSRLLLLELAGKNGIEISGDESAAEILDMLDEADLPAPLYDDLQSILEIISKTEGALRK